MIKRSDTKVGLHQGALFSEEEIQKARAQLIAGLSATRSERRRGPTGQMEYIEAPDHQIRFVYAKAVIEFARGKAVSMSITADLTPKGAGDGSDGFMGSLLADPEARASLRMTLEKLNAAVEKAKPMEIFVSKPLPESPPSTS